MQVTRFVLVIVASFLLAGPGADGASAQDGAGASIVPQTGHGFFINTVAFSPDGRTALSGGMDKTLRLWDVASGRQLRFLTGHNANVTSAAFFPDGRTAISAGEDNVLRLWDVDTGKELRTFKGHTAPVRSLAVSGNGRLVLSGGEDMTLKLWDASTGSELRTFNGHSGKVTAIALSPDGRTAISGSEDNSLKLWDVSNGGEPRTFANGTVGITSLAFSPDGRNILCGRMDLNALRMELEAGRSTNFIMSGDADPSLSLWDASTGRKLRTLPGGSGAGVTAVAFSPDGRIAAAGSMMDLKLWDTATWTQLPNSSEQNPYGHGVMSLAFSADGRTLLTGGMSALKIWDIAAGKTRLTFVGHEDLGEEGSLPYLPPETLPSGDNYEAERREKLAERKAQHKGTSYSPGVHSVGVSPDGRTLLAGNKDSMLRLWDLTTGRLLRTFQGRGDNVTSAVLSTDGRTALSVDNGRLVKLWDIRSGKELRSFRAGDIGMNLTRLSPDGRIALTGSGPDAKLWDIATGKELASLKGHTSRIEAASFSPDGRTVLTASFDGTAKIWDAVTGAQLRSFNPHGGDHVMMAAFSPDGRNVLSGGEKGGMKLWEAATGRELHSFADDGGSLCAVAYSPDGRTVLTGHIEMGMKLRDAATGAVLRTFSGHTSMVCAVAFVPGGRLVASGSRDGSLRIWDLGGGREIARMMTTGDGEWLSITPAGFFTGSDRDSNLLAIVRGSEIVTTGQVHQSLFNPDLVREALAGDPDGEVAQAVKAVNLDKVLDAGPAPAVTITSHKNGSQASSDAVTVTARIADRGKGIGRIEWRVNGITSGVSSVPAGPGPDYTVSRELALDPGKNEIEVIAYEKRNILASPAARAVISYTGPAGAAQPKLHVLAIGVNAYADEGWTPPGATAKLAFEPLHLAVADARAFGAEMKKAAGGLYSEVHVVEALDVDVTPARIGELIKQMAAGIAPRDTFVFYAAAHGYSVNGNYYLIPQDYQGGNNPQALKTRAIGQDLLQHWIANYIKARKGVILLDTCESGALVGGYTKSRTEVPSSEAAIGRLHEATGRPVLTAAATGKPAFEGYKGHGVFTYALMEALHKGDTNNNGKIELTELAAHVGKRVPELVAELDDHGGVVKGVTVIAARGAGGDKQSAQFGSTGEDFAIVARLP